MWMWTFLSCSLMASTTLEAWTNSLTSSRDSMRFLNLRVRSLPVLATLRLWPQTEAHQELEGVTNSWLRSTNLFHLQRTSLMEEMTFSPSTSLTSTSTKELLPQIELGHKFPVAQFQAKKTWRAIWRTSVTTGWSTLSGWVFMKMLRSSSKKDSRSRITMKSQTLVLKPRRNKVTKTQR